MKEESKNTTENPYQGFDLYPERRPKKKDPSFWDKFFSSDQEKKKYLRHKCEKAVLKNIKESQLLKILLYSLKQAGCPVNLKRHIVCEDCSSQVSGGYDPEFNQIIICQNSKKTVKYASVVILHELIHMFDYCVNKVNFKNLEHLACTEIRAANLAHCSFLSSLFLTQSSIFNIKETHQYCVKYKAAESITASRKVDFQTALETINKVFDRCYNDLEPIGRRLRRNSCDSELAYIEGLHFGFFKDKKKN